MEGKYGQDFNADLDIEHTFVSFVYFVCSPYLLYAANLYHPCYLFFCTKANPL